VPLLGALRSIAHDELGPLAEGADGLDEDTAGVVERLAAPHAAPRFAQQWQGRGVAWVGMFRWRSGGVKRYCR
jgi:hypothetical protein